MKINKKKFLVLATAAAVVPALTILGVGSASADPTNPSGPRQLAGVGSDTTEEVMNGMADAIVIGGTKPLASYNATGGAFDSKASGCNYAANPGNTNGPRIRANGSGAGRDRLLETLNSGDDRANCLDFARSSSLNLNAASQRLTYIPFALDGVTYAIRSNSGISKRLTLANLTSIYRCDASTTASFAPLLPQSGSGTRSFFLSTLGLTEATKGACVRDTFVDPADGQTKSVQEHNGRALINTRNIVPFSTGQYSAQSVGAIADVRFEAVLGGINGVPGQAVNSGAPATREVFNVLPQSRLGTQPTQQVFVGGNSEICRQTGVIGRAGLATVANCGDTSRSTG